MDLEIFEMRERGRTGYSFTAPNVAVSCADVELAYEGDAVRVTQRGELDGPGPWTATGPDHITALLGLIAARWGFVASFEPVAADV